MLASRIGTVDTPGALALLDRVAAAANRPVDGASAAVFRAIFGALAFLGVVRFFAYGWIDEFYVRPEHHFHYQGFGWVSPWPAAGMYVHFAVMGAAALAVAVGYRYRLAIVVYFLAFTYAELLDATTYLNHYYWVTLTAGLMIWMPLHRVGSVDLAQGRVEGNGTVPLWVITMLRAQLAVVYLFAGLAKLNLDWLLHAEPLRIWLANHQELPILGALLATDAAAFALSWAGAAFDCTIVAWLLWGRSRPVAYAVVIGFHVMTWILFPIGTFPWLMIGGTLIFFAPGWPRTVASRILMLREFASSPALPRSTSRAAMSRLALVAVAAFALAQVAIPLRHYAYPGDVRWNENGYYFSWRVMLSEKAGFTQFRVVDPATGATWIVSPDDYYTELQVRVMSGQPDLVLQAAHTVRDDFRARGYPGIEVYAESFVAFNGRPAAQLIDPDVDLGSVARRPGAQPWVEPMPPRAGTDTEAAAR